MDERTGLKPLAWAIAICVGVALFVVIPPWTWWDWGLKDTYCGSDEDVSICVREWGPSIIGLLAFLASSVAVIYLVIQVREMQHQRQMLEKQLAYDRGDIEPELELLDNVQGMQSGRFKVTNYNRQALKICEIRWLAPPQFVGTDHIDNDNGDLVTVVDDKGMMERWQKIRAWQDRSTKPPSFVGEFAIGKRNGEDPSRAEQKLRATLQIVGFYVGTRQKFTLTSWAPIGEVYY